MRGTQDQQVEKLGSTWMNDRIRNIKGLNERAGKKALSDIADRYAFYNPLICIKL